MTDDVAPAPEPAAEVPAAPAEPVPETLPVPDPAVAVSETEAPVATETLAAPEPIAEATTETNDVSEATDIPVVGTVPAVKLEPAPEPSSVTQPASAHALSWSKVDPARARAGRRRRVEDNLEKILVFARTKPSITNDMVEKLLHVSGATATRYLNTLVLRGKLRREGRARGVKYLVI